MKLRTTIVDLYEGRCILWVEDELTRLVLTGYWQDTQIDVLTAGGSDGVRALVTGAPREVRGRSVVGLVDRDMKIDNRSDWDNPNVHVLRLPVHEFENLLLDFNVLSAISGESAESIEQHAASFIATHAWWMACKHVLHEMRRDLGSGFPEDPGLERMSEQDAAGFIKSANFWKNHPEALRTWKGSTYIEQRVTDIGKSYLSDTSTEDGLRNFSGKELFRHLCARVRGLSKHARGRTLEEKDENLGLLFAQKLREYQKISPTARLLDDLRAALRKRAGLS